MLLGQSRSLKNHVKIYTSNANESKDVKTASHLATPQNDKFQSSHAGRSCLPGGVLGRGSHVSWVYQGGAGRLRRLITTDVPDKVHQVGEDGLEGHRRA